MLRAMLSALLSVIFLNPHTASLLIMITLPILPMRKLSLETPRTLISSHN